MNTLSSPSTLKLAWSHRLVTQTPITQTGIPVSSFLPPFCAFILTSFVSSFAILNGHWLNWVVLYLIQVEYWRGFACVGTLGTHLIVKEYSSPRHPCRDAQHHLGNGISGDAR